MAQDLTNIELVTRLDPARALGLSVSYLMTKPAYSKLSFGTWSRVLVGQINRGHYVLAYRDKTIVGFAGWALSSLEHGEAWLAGTNDLSFENSKVGEVMLINAWAADDEAIVKALEQHLREAGKDQSHAFFRRFYSDGRIRPGRVAINTRSQHAA
jgi:hemolysin-activating ACP:hemolysin acyltransferase